MPTIVPPATMPAIVPPVTTPAIIPPATMPAIVPPVTMPAIVPPATMPAIVLPATTPAIVLPVTMPTTVPPVTKPASLATLMTQVNFPAVTSAMETSITCYNSTLLPSESTSFCSFPLVPTSNTPDPFSSLVLEVERMTSPQAERVLDELRYMDAGNYDPYNQLAHTDSGTTLII